MGEDNHKTVPGVNQIHRRDWDREFKEKNKYMAEICVFTVLLATCLTSSSTDIWLCVL